MAILVLGAYGLIGSAILDGLQRSGRSIVGVGRYPHAAAVRWPGVRWIRQDISRLVRPEDWKGLLDGVEGVVNASGALQDGPADDIRALQVDAMIALFDACAERRMPLVNISAAGVENAIATFMATKNEADRHLRSLDFDWWILRPGMVLSGSAYGGSAMVRAIASFPMVLPMALSGRVMRTVPVEEIAAAVELCLNGAIPAKGVHDLVSFGTSTIDDVLLAFRSWLGIPGPAMVLRLPHWLGRSIFLLGDAVGLLGWRSAMRTAAWQQMERGVDGDPEPWAAVAGRRIEDVAESLKRYPAGVQERWFARLWLLKPFVIATLSLFWLLSGIVGLLRVEQAVLVLPDLPFGAAIVAVVAGGLVDVAIGVGIALRRSSRFALLASIVVALGYVACGTMLSPELWADPLGPLVKVPSSIVLALVGLAILEDR